jgi:hypothetical protein
MLKHVRLLIPILVFSAFTFAQAVQAPADAFQVGYAANMRLGDSYVNLVNAGSVNGFEPAGSICANVYVFQQSQELVACCTCPLTPNASKALSVREDLINNTLTAAVPTGISIAVLAATGPCNAASVSPAVLAPGLRAWGTTIHALPGGAHGITETTFSPVVLSETQFLKMTSYCGFIQAIGGGYGICGSCRPRALGAGRR